jgi:siroheme synthase-like protein
MQSSNMLYPIFLKLDQLHVLLVGAGNVALEKLESLLGNSPKTTITIVAPIINPAIQSFILDYPNCNIQQRIFQPTDLENKELVICATDNPTLHQQIKILANKKKLLVNVADTPPLCDFYLGSIVQKGHLKIAISTNGKSPTIAKRVKEVLNDSLPDEIDDLLYHMQQIRNKISGDFAEKVKQLNELTKSLLQK